MDVKQTGGPRAGAQPRWRPLALFLAALLAVGAGTLYLVEWLKGLRGAELLEFTTIYLCFPLGLSLLLLFSALYRREQ